MYWYDLLQTKYGWIGVLGSSKGLRRITLPVSTTKAAIEPFENEAENAAFVPNSWHFLKKLLEELLRGEPASTNPPLDYHGVPSFTKAAWEACRTIPPGETRSYKWLATAAGNASAARAAGQAMARNRFPLIIPCHRVVASSGNLHGYGGGLSMKAMLLSAERTHV